MTQQASTSITIAPPVGAQPAKRVRARKARTTIRAVKKEVEKEVNREMKNKARISGAKAMARAPAEATAKSRYLRTLLDPEAFGPTCYPDDFGDKVTLGKFVLSKTVQVDSSGNFAVWANPTLNATLAYPPTSAGFTATYLLAQEYSQDSSDPLHPRVSISATAGDQSYVKFPVGPGFTDSNGDAHILEVTEGTKIRLPKGYTAASITIIAAGTGAWDALGLTWQTRVPGGATSILTPGTPASFILGHDWFQLQVTKTATASKTYLQKLNISLSITTAANNAPWIFDDVPDYDLLVGDDENDVDGGVVSTVTTTTPLYMEYRPVAMSLLVSFVGNELYNGGTIAAKYLSGGETPGRLNYPTYEELAQVPNAFQGPLKTGAYCWWKPTDPKDVSFREPNYQNTTGDLPSLYVAGKATDAANTQIRLRLCICVEAKTTRQILPTEYSTVNPDEIAAASQALQGISNVMENPLHLEKIGNFLRSIVRKGENFWAKYQRPIMAAATAAKTVAPLFLAA